MEVLNKWIRGSYLLILAIGTVACTGDVTQVIELETDTYISNESSEVVAEETFVKVTNNGGLEERAILKLPSGENDTDENLAEVLSETIYGVFLMPIYILTELLTSCSKIIMQGQYLNSAVLRLEYSDLGGLAVGDLRLQLLNRPWWHTASWTRAHPFTKDGVWSTPGGDVDESFAAIVASNDTGSSIDFNIRDYFRDLIDGAKTIHYGFLISTTGTGEAEFHSTQATAGNAPAVIATYDEAAAGNCISGGTGRTGLVEVTTYLGKESRRVVRHLLR